MESINKILSSFELKGGRYMDQMNGLQVGDSVKRKSSSLIE